MGDRLIVTILTLTLTLTRLLRVTRDPQAEDLKAQQVVYPSVTEEEYDTLVKESEAVEKKWKLFRKCDTTLSLSRVRTRRVRLCSSQNSIALSLTRSQAWRCRHSFASVLRHYRREEAG